MEAMAMVCRVVTLAVLIALSFAIDVPSVVLKNAAKPGLRMPVVGIGTGSYRVHRDPSVDEKAVGEWLSLGGRRIDNALDYGNEVEVGRAIKDSNVSRSEVFLTTKIELAGYNETFQQMNKILSDLQLDYVDLLLIHWPDVPNPWADNTTDPACKRGQETYRVCRQSVWKAFEELFKSGKALAIGVSNFEQNHLEDILMLNSLKPSVNQVEFQPYWHEDDLVAFCKSHDILFNGYAPLGTPDWAPSSHDWNGTILQLPVIDNIAKTHNVSAAQVILRWQWQQSVVVNPRSWNVDHMKENLNFFDFELSDNDIKQISSIKPPKDPKVCPDPHDIK